MFFSNVYKKIVFEEKIIKIKKKCTKKTKKLKKAPENRSFFQ